MKIDRKKQLKDVRAQGKNLATGRRKMLKVGVFVDISNLYFTVKKKFSGKKLDYLKFLKQCTGGQKLIHAFAYGAQEDDQASTFINCLKNFGYTPKFKKPKLVAPNVKKADWDVGITIDVIRFLPRLDVVVIGSSDSDFAPLVIHCQSQGTKVHVWGALISRELKNAADTYHEIGESLLHTNGTEVPESSGVSANSVSDSPESPSPKDPDGNTT